VVTIEVETAEMAEAVKTTEGTMVVLDLTTMTEVEEVNRTMETSMDAIIKLAIIREAIIMEKEATIIKAIMEAVIMEITIITVTMESIMTILKNSTLKVKEQSFPRVVEAKDYTKETTNSTTITESNIKCWAFKMIIATRRVHRLREIIIRTAVLLSNNNLDLNQINPKLTKTRNGSMISTIK
jgi:hypothetical protein